MDDKQSTLAVVGMVAIVAVVGVITLMQGSAQSTVVVPADNVAGESFRHLMYASEGGGGSTCSASTTQSVCDRASNCKWCTNAKKCVTQSTTCPVI